MTFCARNAPRHDWQGLALITVNFDGVRSTVRMLEVNEAHKVWAVPVAVLVFILHSFGQVARCFRDPTLAEVTKRPPRRTPLCTQENKRMSMDVLFPLSYIEIDVLMIVSSLRRGAFPQDLFVVHEGVFGPGRRAHP